MGKPSYTGLGLAKLALKFNCPILPVRFERTVGVHHKITYYNPFYPIKGVDEDDSLKKTMQKVNNILSDWIREKPHLWWWTHHKWKM
jgi:KDO2-lipid IV(A) lauroyltransferase